MHLTTLISRSSFAQILAFFLISQLLLHVSANITPSNPLIRRAESVGSSCDQEGLWNCMTHSFQRCASGRWSEEMKCSAGTVCSPSGHTDVFKVDYENGQNNQAPATGGASIGIKGSLNKGVMGLVFGLWMIWEVAF